jgi:hypothetical protein
MDNVRQRLQENYEDALLTLLMDDFILTEDQKYQSAYQKRQGDPSLEPPSGMEERGLKAIGRAFRKNHRKTFLKASGKVVSRVAVIVLALNIVFGVSFFTVEAFRLDVLNMALEYQETHTTVKFIGSSGEATSAAGYTAEDLQRVLPENFALEDYEALPDGEYALFVDENNVRIIWNVDPITTTVNLDTEAADHTEEITVSGYEGIAVEKGGMATVLWGDTATEKLYCISAELPYEELLQIVNALTA